MKEELNEKLRSTKKTTNLKNKKKEIKNFFSLEFSHDRPTHRHHHDHPPPLKPPDPQPPHARPMSLSFKSILLQNKANTDTDEQLWRDWGLQEDDTFATKIGTPLQLPDDVRERICRPWQNALIIKLIGTVMGFKSLLAKLNAIWRPTSSFQMIDIGFDFYVLKFFIPT